MKKLISLILAFAMVFSLAMPAMAAEVTGNKEDPLNGDVSASYTPIITITGVTLSGHDGNGSVTVDEDSKTYTITIPAGADNTKVTVTVSGQNLDKIPVDNMDYRVRLYVAAHDPLCSSDYKAATENISFVTNVPQINVGTHLLQYSTDGGTNWIDTGWNVVIQKEVVKYNVTVNTAENGTVTADKTTAAEGETVKLFVSAADGYELDTLSVMQGETPVEVSADHTFVMPAGDVTVTAAFKETAKTYTVTINPAENGSIVVNPSDYHAGDDVTLGVIPADGYELDKLTVSYVDADGKTQTVNYTDTYTFVMPAANVTVTATFAKLPVAKITGATVYVNEVEQPKGNIIITAGDTVKVIFKGEYFDKLTDEYMYSVSSWSGSFSSTNTAITVDTANNTATVSYAASLLTDCDNSNIHYTNAGDATFTLTGYTLTYLEKGTDLTKIYFNNGGSSDWTNVTAYFFDSRNNQVGTAELSIVAGESTVYSSSNIPEWAYKVIFNNGTDATAIVNIPLAADGDNQFNLADSTWSEFTATEQTTTSAEIVWGSMAFTYTDGEDSAEGAWSNDGSDAAGTVTVTNTGDTAINVTVSYEATTTEYGEITGSFDAEDATVNEDYAYLEKDVDRTFTLTLSGQPTKAIPAGTTIGQITIVIEQSTYIPV